MNAADIMSQDVITVMPGHSIWHAARIMLDHHVSGLPVIDGEGRLRGMFTEGDLLRRAEYGLTDGRLDWLASNSAEGSARDYVHSHSWRVEDVMTSPAVSVRDETSLVDVAVLFGTRGIKRVPVLKDGRLVGIVSRADLLHVIAAGAPERIAEGDDALWVSAETRLRDADGVFAKCPEVTVVHGVVHLWGSVRSEAERDAARVAVEAIQGVQGIENHLTVSSASSA